MNVDFLNQAVAKFLSGVVALPADELAGMIEIPAHANQGDRSFPCFRFSKERKTSPQKLAQEWFDALSSTPLPEEIERIEVLSGYINFFAKTPVLAKRVLGDIRAGQYGFVTREKPPIAIVEYSSPNIAKPFSIAHIRSTNIGACLSRIFAARGWKVVRINHLGDWGTQFGKLMSAYRRWGSAEDLDERPMNALFKLYVKYHEEEKSDPTLIDEAREWFSKLEKGDTDAKELWDWFRKLTMKELERLYAMLGVEFDHYWGESFYVHLLPKLMDDLYRLGLPKESEDAIIVDLEDHGLHKALLKKKDESSLYITRDLAAAIYREQHLHFDLMLYVVGNQQQLHFQQLFKILELMGFGWVKKCEHIQFGHVSFGDQSMSTRKGNVVFLSDVIDKAVELARKIVEEKNPTLENKDQVALDVALGAVFFADISARRTKDVKFAWEDILNFEGETGPYLQYSLVRMQSLLEKYGQATVASFDEARLSAKEEGDLIRGLSQFPMVLEKAEREREPMVVAQYLIEISRQFNRFYSNQRVLDGDAAIRDARMVLVEVTASVLSSGLSLLGIPRPKKM